MSSMRRCESAGLLVMPLDRCRVYIRTWNTSNQVARMSTSPKYPKSHITVPLAPLESHTSILPVKALHRNFEAYPSPFLSFTVAEQLDPTSKRILPTPLHPPIQALRRLLINSTAPANAVAEVDNLAVPLSVIQLTNGIAQELSALLTELDFRLHVLSVGMGMGCFAVENGHRGDEISVGVAAVDFGGVGGFLGLEICFALVCPGYGRRVAGGSLGVIFCVDFDG